MLGLWEKSPMRQRVQISKSLLHQKKLRALEMKKDMRRQAVFPVLALAGGAYSMN